MSSKAYAQYADMTAEQLRALADVERKRSYDSFERCDTDGFLSQAAFDTHAQMLLLQADIADNGGVWHYDAIFDLDGNIIETREIKTRYGWTRVDNAGRFYNESQASNDERRRAANRKKGFTVGTVTRRSYADIRGFGSVCVKPLSDDIVEIVTVEH